MALTPPLRHVRALWGKWWFLPGGLPLAYLAFVVAMGLFGWGTYVTLRWLETRKVRKQPTARHAGRET